jgi:uncharacterized protein YqjF (DUF2071 family)
MVQQRAFLTADWNNLLMLNYAVDPLILQSHVPEGTQLASFEGTTYISLVGFEFNNTRISDISVPFHGSFEEVNLRFYVRRGDRRGVVFVRELVPKLAVAFIARIAYGEKYSRVAMAHRIHYRLDRDAVEAEYSWGSGAGLCSMRVETESATYLPADGSLSQFITEHYWGYATQRGGGTIEYEVQHPKWQVREASTAVVNGDATQFYGADFGRAVMRKPDSAFLAEGSDVTVFRGERIA